LSTSGLTELDPQVVALAGALSHTRENRSACRSAGNTVIISWNQTVLPTPAPPNRAILPPRTYRGQQVDDLEARLKHLSAGFRSSSKAGGCGESPAVEVFP